MSLEVLLSCMNQEKFSIIEDSNLTNIDTLIINQCNREEEIILDDKHRVINTMTVGLSVSRNIGLENARREICLLGDDDETFVDGLEDIVLNAYKRIKNADIIIFKAANWPEVFKGKAKRLSKLELLKVSSVQISFKRKSVVGKVKFDSFLGAGTPNGSGEENKFLLECYKKGLKIYYVPVEILTLRDAGSTWFKGFDEGYFYRRGYTTRYIYGLGFAIVYAVYFIIMKRNLYKSNLSMERAFYYLFKGIRDNCIPKQKMSKTKIKIFLLGDFDSDNGPGNANKQIRNALSLKYEIEYSRAVNKIERIFEMYRGIRDSDLLLICSASKINYLAVNNAKKCGKKIIYLMHGYTSYERQIENPGLSDTEMKKVHEYEQFIFNEVDRIVCVSRRSMKFMKSQLVQYAEKIDYIFNIVETDNIRKICKENDKRKKQNQILSIGGGMKQKNIITLAEVIDNMKKNLNLIVVGKNENDGEKIKSFDCVTWIDHLSHKELLRLMTESNIYIQNSVFETFCLAIIEALFAGCNLLISNSTGCLDLFENCTENDIIYDVYDQKEIAKKIQYLLDNPNNKRLMKGFKEEYISREWQANRWQEIINSTINV